jgi:hypothetical protein
VIADRETADSATARNAIDGLPEVSLPDRAGGFRSVSGRLRRVANLPASFRRMDTYFRFDYEVTRDVRDE